MRLVHPPPAPVDEPVRNRLRTGIKDAWRAAKATIWKYHADKAGRLSAALAFYAFFSIAPLLVIVIAIAGRVLGADAVRHEIVAQLGGLVGVEAAAQIDALILNAGNPTTSLVASLLAGITLLLGATAVFSQLKDALNTVWDANPPKRHLLAGFFRDRLLALAVVLGVAFLLLVSLVISAALAALSRWAAAQVPDFPFPLIRWLEFLFSFAVVTLLFAMIYKILPDERIGWEDVWIGAGVTALLFNIGKHLIGLYLGRSSMTSVFGAAGSLAVILAWIYYSAAIFLLGAEFTHVYSQCWGSGAGRPLPDDPDLTPGRSSGRPPSPR